MIIGKSLLYERVDFHQIASDIVKSYGLKSKLDLKQEGIKLIIIGYLILSL